MEQQEKPEVVVIMIGPPRSYKSTMMEHLTSYRIYHNWRNRVKIRGIEWQTQHPTAQAIL